MNAVKPSPQYFTSAHDAGLVHQLDGHNFVAAELENEVRFCYVEYSDPALLSHNAESLVSYLRCTFASAEFIRLRADSSVSFTTSWECERTDLEFTTDGSAHMPESVRISESAEDEALVHQWLYQGFQTGAHERGRTLSEAQLRSDTDEVFQDPSRESLVFLDRDEPVGHATLLHDQIDHLTGSAYTDLVDILIEPPFFATAMPALSAAAAFRAHEKNGRLLGNVVHPTADPQHGLDIVQRLESRGWTSQYRTWKRTLT